MAGFRVLVAAGGWTADSKRIITNPFSEERLGHPQCSVPSVPRVHLHSTENDYAEDVGPGVGDHAGEKGLAPGGK